LLGCNFCNIFEVTLKMPYSRGFWRFCNICNIFGF